MDPTDMAGAPIYIRSSDLRSNRERYFKLRLCEHLDYYVPGYIISVQQTNDVWKIWTKTDAARDHLLNKIVSIKFNNRTIELHDKNPLLSPPVPSEKIVFKDLPLDMPNEEILNFLEKEHPHILIRSNVIFARVPSRDNNLTQFLSGDRVVYVKQGFFPVLPKNAQINSEPCKIWHKNQEIICKRCGSDRHRGIDNDKCEAYDENPNIEGFRDDNHPCSNFYVCQSKITVFGKQWPTSEHPYQYRKLMENGYDELAEEIVNAPTARAAKAIANRVPAYNLPSWENSRKLDVMYEILVAKNKYCKEFSYALHNSGDREFVECTVDHFWGAGIPLDLALQTNPQMLLGRNELGKLLR